MRVELDLPAGAAFELARKGTFRYAADGREFETLEALAHWMSVQDKADRTLRVVREFSHDEQQELSTLLSIEREKTAQRRARRKEIRVLQNELRDTEKEQEQLKLRVSLGQNEVDEDILERRLAKRHAEVVAQIKAIEAELKTEFETLTATT